jgi:hypothetical protein
MASEFPTPKASRSVQSAYSGLDLRASRGNRTLVAQEGRSIAFQSGRHVDRTGNAFIAAKPLR